MELLPKDVLFIVYRYVHDYLYTKVKQQYRMKWVPMWCKMGFWSDFGVGVANWRNIADIYDYSRSIYLFTNPYLPCAQLPKHYV